MARRAAERDAENARAAELAAADEIPALNGTDKQIAWAESIRRSYIDLPDKRVGLFCSSSKTTQDQVSARTDGASAEKQTEIKERAYLFIEQCLTEKAVAQTEAKWWIDHRHNLAMSVLELFSAAEEDAVLRAAYGLDGAADLLADAAHAKQLEDEANALAAQHEAERAVVETLRPENPTTTEVALINVDDNRLVTIRLDEMHEDFRLMIRNLGFTWRQWSRSWGRHIHEYLDLSSELAHVVAGCLRVGVAVRCADDLARTMAVGTLPARQERWMSHTNRGHILITWESGNDTLYKLAKRLPGAGWNKVIRGVTVKPSQFALLRDFADRNSFSISPAAERALTLAQEQYETIPTAVPALPPSPQSNTDSEKPAALAFDSFEPDNSLLDDETYGFSDDE